MREILTTILMVSVTVWAIPPLFVGETAFAAQTPEAKAKEEALKLLEEDIDWSNTLFPPQDHPTLERWIGREERKLKNNRDATWRVIGNIASLYKDIKDYDHALQFYTLLDNIDCPDLNYRLERGQIYIKRDNPRKAVDEIDPLRESWPVPETFIYLARAYQHIEGTPHEKIDAIYEEGLYRHNGQSDIRREYNRWLEKSGRRY